MTSGIYTHKNSQGFQKGHTLGVGRFKNGVPYKQTQIGIEKNAIAKTNYRVSLRLKIIEVLGGKCVKCGFTDTRALQVDHVNGGGNRERVAGKLNSVNALYRDVCTSEGKYQLLCANCNVIKRVTNKEH